MDIYVDDNFIYFSNYSTEQKYYLENNLQATYLKGKGYRLPLNLWSLREVWYAFEEARCASIQHVGDLLRNEVERLALIKKLPPKQYHEWLREYQNADIEYLKELHCAGVFNEPRTGKTPTMINLIKELNVHHTIIVTPASLMYNWQREFEKWYPKARVGVISGDKAKRRRLYEIYCSIPRSVIIISKDTLKNDINELSGEFDVAIVDEAHYLRNYKTAQSKAVFKLKAKRKYALTGTPTVKHAVDIFGILHFLYPKKFPSYWQFADRYFQVGENYMGYNEVGTVRIQRLEELQTMIGLLSVQRLRKDVMQWLPSKQYTTFYCEMEAPQRRLYNEMLKYFNTVDENGVELDASSVLSQLIRLRQLCLEPSLVGLDCSSAKTTALLDYFEDNKQQTVVMSMFTSYLKLIKPKLEDLGLRVGMIHGEMSNQEKMQQAEKFQRGEIDVLLCNIISAGTGFTLDRAETIIFMDKAWNPADNEQAEDRITPTTPDKVHKHDILSFVCQNSVDEKINTLLEQKKSITDLINEGGLGAIKNYLLN